MQKTFILSFFFAVLTTSLGVLAAPIDFIQTDSIQVRSNDGTLNFNVRSIDSNLIDRRSSGMEKEAFWSRDDGQLPQYIDRTADTFPKVKFGYVPTEQRKLVQRSSIILESRMGKDGKKGGGKSGGKPIGAGPYAMDPNDYHRNVKPIIQQHFAANDPKNGLNGNNPDYDIDRKGNVTPRPQNGSKGSGYSTTMKNIFPNGVMTS